MQQLSGSSGRGGTNIPPINVLFFLISERRSRGEESREEKVIAGPESSVAVIGRFGGEAVVGGWLEIGGDVLLVLGNGWESIEA
jgi:hypothetical protein